MTLSQLPSPLLSMLIEEFIDSIRWSNRSISTVNSYRHDLISFLNHQEAPNDFTLEQFTVDALEGYFLEKSECVKPATLARYQSSLRSLCQWLIRKNYLQKNPFDQIESVKAPPPLPKANKQERGKIEREKIQEEEVRFADPKLELMIRSTLGSWRKLFEGVISNLKLKGLTVLEASHRDIGDLSGIEYCTELQNLDLRHNRISDISPLVRNSGIGKGHSVDLRGNPLNDEAYEIHIPALQERGVNVQFDPKP